MCASVYSEQLYLSTSSHACQMTHTRYNVPWFLSMLIITTAYKQARIDAQLSQQALYDFVTKIKQYIDVDSP